MFSYFYFFPKASRMSWLEKLAKQILKFKFWVISFGLRTEAEQMNESWMPLLLREMEKDHHIANLAVVAVFIICLYCWLKYLIQ